MLDGLEMSGKIAAALKEGFVDSKAYLERDAPHICNEIIGEAILGYISGHLEITYDWPAVDPSGAPDEPTFDAAVSPPGQGILIPSGAGGFPAALDALLERIAELIKGNITISLPSGYTLAAPPSFDGWRLAVTMQGESSPASFWDTLCCALVKSIRDHFQSQPPSAGAHEAYVCPAAAMTVPCANTEPPHLAGNGAGEETADDGADGETEEDGEHTGYGGTLPTENEEPPPALAPFSVWVNTHAPLEADEGWIRFQNVTGERPYGEFAYAWYYNGCEILLRDDSWNIARDAGWAIQDVLNTANPVIWRFLRDILARFPNIRQIIITSMTRPENNAHGWGRALDIGKISFIDDTLAIVYNRAYNQYAVGPADVPILYRAIHETVRDWIWGLGRGYVEAYLDPWYVRGVYGLDYANPDSWNPNLLRQDAGVRIREIEWDHRDHLHLTFAGS